MPAIPPPLPLEIDDLPRVTHYFGNKHHRNHRGYLVQPPWEHGLVGDPGFVSAITHAIEVINGSRIGKGLIRRASYWYVFSFKKGSFLTPQEKTSYQGMVLNLLGARRPLYGSWHEHKTNGAADLNILDPEIRLQPVPWLDRPRSINRLFRLRHASDAWTIAANRAREAAGKDRIPAVDPIADTATTGLARLVRIIASSLPPEIQDFGRRQIPDALRVAGFRAEDWTLSLTGILAIHRWPGASPNREKKSRPYTVAVKELVTWVWLHLSRRRSRTGKTREAKGRRKDGDVIPILRTETEVIQPQPGSLILP